MPYSTQQCPATTWQPFTVCYALYVTVEVDLWKHIQSSLRLCLQCLILTRIYRVLQLAFVGEPLLVLGRPFTTTCLSVYNLSVSDHLSTCFRWMWLRLCQWTVFCSKSNQRDGGEDHGAAQNIQVLVIKHYMSWHVLMNETKLNKRLVVIGCLEGWHQLKQRCTSWKM